MMQRFLSCLAACCAVSVFIGCGDDDDDVQGAVTTTSAVTSGGAGGTTGGAGGTTDGAGGTTSGGAGGTTAGGAGGTTAGGMAGDAGEGGMAGAAMLMDGEVLHAARAANVGELGQAEVAVLRTDTADVLDFAQMMIDDHTTAIMNADMLADDEDLVLTTNPVSQMLQDESQEIIMMLDTATDEEFDLVYMNSQVTAHQRVLEVLSDQLLPQADNSELESYLMQMQTSVEEHLESAEAIVEELE